ncbi:MAG TPA: glucose-6-phosphate dehydrogenase assembly protein OpcA, partial [bacterium]|nr:glucose-6-phosphate dehydrogenase assembly protein OpcA [bacterium]
MAQPVSTGATTPPHAQQLTPQRSELGTWRGEDVRVGEVLEALMTLRHAERKATTRTSVVNLVVVPSDEVEAERACTAMHELGARHPGRIVALLPDDGRKHEGMDAEVTLHAQEWLGHAVWSDDVRLWPRGPVMDHLDSLIEPLTLPDLPIAVWYVGRLPSPTDSLVQAADSVIVDAKEAGGREAWKLIADLSRLRPVVDLCWVRLQPWRELLAALFEAPPLQPYLGGVRGVSVTGKPGSRHLMAGWLSSRLHVDRSAFDLADARHVEVHLEAEHEGVAATFELCRVGDSRTLEATARLHDGTQHRDRLSLPELSLPWSLGQALGRLEGHRAYRP